MQKLLIKGGKKLSGEVVISGSKNASLPIIISSLLFDDSVHFENVPKVRDIFTLINLIKVLGREVEFNEEKEILKISNKNKNKYFAPYSIMRTMRAGVLVLAPLLAKFGKARVSLPGGCSIGARPVNLHLEALKKLGAKINVKNGYIDAIAPKGLSGSNIKFPSISVGATESIIIAAVLAKGITKISNAAIEPEIIDLINFLNKCGADIKYNSKRKIIIKGEIHVTGYWYDEPIHYKASAKYNKYEKNYKSIKQQLITNMSNNETIVEEFFIKRVLSHAQYLKLFTENEYKIIKNKITNYL